MFPFNKYSIDQVKQILEEINIVDDASISIADLKKSFLIFKPDLIEGKPLYDLFVQIQVS